MTKQDLLKSLKLMVHPYLFVLKEGSDIEENYLDYSLMMLKIGPMERIPSPSEYICEMSSKPILDHPFSKN